MLGLILITNNTFAELGLPSIFSDHMVIQREKTVPVWGTANSCASVTVQFAGQSKTTTSDADGKWQITLSSLAASSLPRQMTVLSGTQQIIFTNVLVGDVWLCSGQSNMQMPHEGWALPCDNAAAIISDATNHPNIRLFLTPSCATNEPLEWIDSAWQTCSETSVRPFSACAYAFGRKLNNDLNVPIGLLECACGGSTIETWTPFGDISSITNVDQTTPGALYNGMLHAHIPFAIRGAVWYQGENNHKDGMLYVDKMRMMLVDGWRKLWGYDVPLYLVQIAPYNYSEDYQIIPAFWEAQAKIVDEIPSTAMAVISDAATLDNIHPTNKETPGTRLALLAEKNEYGQALVCNGPTLSAFENLGSQLKLTFSSAAGLQTRDGQSPDWFEIAGIDGIFYSAQASISGSNVYLSASAVPAPASMRFAWSKVAVPNLINGAGLPASAFRAEAEQDHASLSITNGYRTIYEWNIPPQANHMSIPVQYSVNHGLYDTDAFSRVGYLLELQAPSGTLQYAFASMDPFTNDLTKIGVPVSSEGASFMQRVHNLTVRSNVGGVVQCTETDGGNIEFFSGNYWKSNSLAIPNASDTAYDFGDVASTNPAGYSCMQVHNWQNQQTVFALNRWGTAGTVDIGIGNASSGALDWTFHGNATNYLLHRLTVMVSKLQIPEMDDFRTIYELNIPADANYRATAPQYTIDNSETDVEAFGRIGYLLELQEPDGPLQYAFAAMDAFTDNLKEVGVPVSSVGAGFMQKVGHLTVRSNVSGVQQCTNSDFGNIEFWSGDYSQYNAQNIPNASSTAFDFGDKAGTNSLGYSCMQIHNWQSQQTVFALNRWGTAGTVDIGIGNASSGALDWTFHGNATNYLLRRLTVLVAKLRIPEMDDFRTIYELNIPADADYSATVPQYTIDNSETDTGSFSRIAYLLELQEPGGPLQYAFAAMDAFTTDLDEIGVPVSSVGAGFMQTVGNLTVRSNVDGVQECTDMDCGNIEFWSGNYSQSNAQNIPNAADTVFDFGDHAGTNSLGYGCMQVHNWQSQQAVFAVNRWGTAGTVDIGIGNASSGAPDWTFHQNGNSYTVRRLTVMVK